MSNQVLNYPRKLLSDREQTIRDTLARIKSTSDTSIPIPHSMAPYIYVPLAEKDSLNFYIASLTHGGTIILDADTYYLTSGIVMGTANVTLMGMGMFSTELKYILDANTDIVTISASRVTIQDLRISGSDNYTNGGGAIGTGRGIVISAAGTCQEPVIRNVEVANTGSWCIYSKELAEMTDLGTGVSPNKNYGGAYTLTGRGGTVDLTLDNVQLVWPNSGGCFFQGYGGAAPRISALTTNSYSFGTYARIDAVGGAAESLGAVHLFGVSDAVFDNKCVFQSPDAQTGAQNVTHADTDATMLSFLNTGPVLLEGAYFEVLSADCTGSAGRATWLVTAINSSELNFVAPYIKSTVLYDNNTGPGSPLRVFHTPSDTSSVGTIWTDAHASHYRPVYVAADIFPPFEPGDPKTQDTDDFVFQGSGDGNKEAVIKVDNFIVSNWFSGKMREASTSGAGILARRNASFNNRYIKLGKFDDCDLGGLSGGVGPGGTEDLRARWGLWHGSSTRGGIMGYVGGGGGIYVYTTKHATNVLDSVNANAFTHVDVGMSVSGTGIPVGTYVTVHNTNSQVTINNAATDAAGTQSVLTFTSNGAPHREGLWLSSARDNDFRQIPFFKISPSAPSGLLAGDFWMKLTGTPTSSIYPGAQYAWYDGTQWQYVPTGLLAGDMPYYTAAGVSAILGIGAANYVMASTGTAPNWVLDSQRDVVDGLGNVVTSGGFVVVA